MRKEFILISCLAIFGFLSCRPEIQPAGQKPIKINNTTSPQVDTILVNIYMDVASLLVENPNNDTFTIKEHTVFPIDYKNNFDLIKILLECPERDPEKGYNRLIALLNKALKQQEKIDSSNEILGDILIYKGMCEKCLGHLDASIIEFQKALTYYNKVNASPIKKAFSVNMIGQSLYEQSKFSQSKASFINALKLLDYKNENKLKGTYIYALVLNNTAELFRYTGDYSRAIDYYNKAIQYRKKRILDKFELSLSYYGLGRCYIVQEKYDEALDLLEKTLYIRKNLNHDG